MGQYHFIVDMTAKEGLNPHNLGTGLKEWEIVANSPGACAALVGLISTAPGNAPADLGNDPMVGRWAGHRILAVGDYAEDGDIPDFDGPPLSSLFGLVRSKKELEKPTLEDFQRRWSGTRINGHGSGSPEHSAYVAKAYAEALEDHAATKAADVFESIGPMCQGMIEQGASVRLCGHGWLTAVPVRPSATLVGPDGRARYELNRPDAATLNFYERCGITAEDWQRPPRNGAWHAIRDVDVDQGQHRLLVSLDKREFIDPAKFGEAPTTAGIMTGQWGSAAALMITLFHLERRGGGDLPDDDESLAPVKGRWRNTRLAAIGDREVPDMPTIDEIRASFADISDEAMRAVAAAKAW